MKNVKYIILFTATILFTYINQANAITYTNKTFMSLVTPHYYNPMKETTSHRLIKQGSSDENKWGASLIATIFHSSSNNSVGLGKYFGDYYRNTINIGKPDKPGIDFQASLIAHKTTGDTPLAGKLTLNPVNKNYGVYFSYHQELDEIHKNLFLQQ